MFHVLLKVGFFALCICQASCLASSTEELAVKQRVNKAIYIVRSILNNTRNPEYPADVPHAYDDKFILAELATKAAATALLNAIEAIAPGWWGENQKELLEWQSHSAVSLRFLSCERCSFDHTETQEIEPTKKTVTETDWLTRIVKTVTTVDEHYWNFVGSWNLSIFPGVEDTRQIVLLKHESQIEVLKTITPPGSPRMAPRVASKCVPIDLDLTWLVERMRTGSVEFVINRTVAKTPRRNQEIQNAMTFVRSFDRWGRDVVSYFSSLFSIQVERSFDLSILSMQDMFSPVLGLFAVDQREMGKHMVLTEDFRSVLHEHLRILQEKLADVTKHFPSGLGAADGLVTAVPACVFSALSHVRNLLADHIDVINAIEGMLRSQLVAAIGREIGSADFAEYMDFHSQRIFQAAYAPSRFSYAVRRPGRSPEGIVSLESPKSDHDCHGSFGSVSGDIPILVFTSQQRIDASKPMRFALSSAVDVAFVGDRFVHGCVLHRFSTEAPRQVRLTARARQFSSFILLVGRIAPGNWLEPEAALIVKDRDDLTIPISSETFPTPKEFRDAIASLSPEQQEFATAFRNMQLASTLFGLCIIQIKPQMELLLNLPPDSLTKEIQLTQDLMELFIKYQVPADLLSYDGDLEVDGGTKLHAVKGHVSSLLSTINASRQRELDEARSEAQKQQLHQAATQSSVDLGVRPAMEMRAKSAPRTFQYQQVAQDEMHVQTASSRIVHESVAFNEALLGSVEHFGASASTFPGEVSKEQIHEAAASSGDQPDAGVDDLSGFPQRLDARMTSLDDSAALRPTTLRLGSSWKKREQAGLLSPMAERVLDRDAQRAQRDAAFDLLDALSRSGALTVEHASFHVVLAATHSFDQTIIDTVVKGNLNPIEEVERSLLIVASTLHNRSAEDLLAKEHVARVRSRSPIFFS